MEGKGKMSQKRHKQYRRTVRKAKNKMIVQFAKDIKGMSFKARLKVCWMIITKGGRI